MRKRGVLYFLIGVALWFLVDFTTTYAIKDPVKYYRTYMPVILIFYMGCPFIFSLLIYKFKFRSIRLFIAMIIEIITVEILFTKNPLFFSFPNVILAIVAAISLYSFLTFLPKWIADKELKNKKVLAITLTAIWSIITLITIFEGGT